MCTPWCEVQLDGRALGRTPLMRVSVSSGRHTVVLLPRGKGPVGVEVDIVAEEYDAAVAEGEIRSIGMQAAERAIVSAVRVNEQAASPVDARWRVQRVSRAP